MRRESLRGYSRATAGSFVSRFAAASKWTATPDCPSLSIEHADNLRALGSIDRGRRGRIGKSNVEDLPDPIVFANGGEKQAIARDIDAGAEILEGIDRAAAAAHMNLCGDLGAFPPAAVGACYDRLGGAEAVSAGFVGFIGT